ncbi:MAG: hypothetical protein MJ096_03205, partial [Clostridia bacterium]|nr:hypothetical protein [Clostridia bacterium]
MKKRIIWGIILIICAVAVICFAAIPDFALGFDLPVWKILLGAILLYFIIRRIACSSTPWKRLSVFFLLALLFILPEPTTAGAAG